MKEEVKMEKRKIGAFWLKKMELCGGREEQLLKI